MGKRGRLMWVVQPQKGRAHPKTGSTQNASKARLASPKSILPICTPKHPRRMEAIHTMAEFIVHTS